MNNFKNNHKNLFILIVILIAVISLIILFIISTSVYIEITRSKTLKKMNEIEIPKYNDNAFSDLYWLLITGKNEIKFRKEIPYLSFIEMLRYEYWLKGTIWIAQDLRDYISEIDERNRKRYHLERNFDGIWISWHWNAQKALAICLENMYFNENIFGLKNAAIYYFNKDYTQLDLHESAMLYAFSVSGNYNRKNKEILEKKVNYFLSNYLELKEEMKK